jgi:hypothetical protein
MREDLILATTAQRLRQAGLPWQPQIGDWCALIAAIHLANEEAGIWMIVEIMEQAGQLTVIDGASYWTARRIVTAEALWLPTSGQMKAWLRGHGYQVSTTEGAELPTARPTTPQAQRRPAWATTLMGEPPPPTSAQPLPTQRHQCRALLLGHPPLEAFGMTEAEAVAEVVGQVLATDERIVSRQGW